MKFEHELTIARPPAEVFGFLSDLTNLPRWQSSVKEISAEGEGELAVGSRFREVREFMGKKIESTLEVTALDPAGEFSIRVIAGPIPFTVRHLIEPAGEGTRLQVLGEGEPGGFLKLGGGLVGRAVKRQSQSDFSRLKTLLEQGG